MINYKIIYSLLTIACLASSCNSKQNETLSASQSTNKVILSSEIVFEKLNPARGDQSPQAGTIWGDRNGTEATGFLAKFVDGFSSPPHIHNITYRAVVIKGLVHNDDPNADKMWMPAGSFWTQPVGEAHITAAKGAENIALVEIDHGPYLVKPTDSAFDSGERPINIDASNIVWLDALQTNIIAIEDDPASGPKLAFLWENDNSYGRFLKLPAGFKGKILSKGSVFRAVIIQGEANYTMPKEKALVSLDPGSYFSSEGESVHEIRTAEECLIYIRTNAKFTVQ